MDKITIDWPSSGVKTYGEFTEGTERVKLQSGFQVDRVINKDRGFENSKVKVALGNIDREFDALMKSADRYLLGRTLCAYRNGELIFTGKVSDFPECEPRVFALEADTAYFGFNDVINKAIQINDFPNVPAENEGKYGNIIYGTASDESGEGVGILIARRVDNNKYLAAWHHIKSLISVYNASGSAITGSCTLDNNADGYAYINYTSTDPEIYFNAEGKESGGSLITNPANMLDDLNNNYGSFTLAGVTEAAEEFNSRGYTGAVIVIHNDIRWREFFKHFAVNFDTLIYQKANGDVGLKITAWGGSENAEAIVDYIDVATFKNWRDTSNIVGNYTRKYWYHFRQGRFQRTPQDVTGSTSWKAKDAEIDMRYNRDSTTSYDVAGRAIYFQKAPRVWYQFEIPQVKIGSIDLASVITLIPPAGYYKGEERLVQIYGVSILNNKPRVQLRAVDITDLQLEGITLLLDSDPDVYLLTNPGTGILI